MENDMKITLPSQPFSAPLRIRPNHENRVTVADDKGKVVAELHPLEEATFEVAKRKWWQFWRQELYWRRHRY